jgi:hypothetical protein
MSPPEQNIKAIKKERIMSPKISISTNSIAEKIAQKKLLSIQVGLEAVNYQN